MHVSLSLFVLGRSIDHNDTARQGCKQNEVFEVFELLICSLCPTSVFYGLIFATVAHNLI